MGTSRTQPEVGLTQAAAPFNPTPSAVHRNVLILEDDDVDYKRHKKFLTADLLETYNLQRASTVNQALELTNNENFDCILVDYYLPDATGMDFVSQLKQKSNEPPAMVLLTGQQDTNLVAKAMKEGVQDYLDKNSVTPESLTRTIRSAIHLAEMREELNKSNQKLRERALHDALTGLANRTLFEDRCEGALNLCQRNGNKPAILLLDLNDFKPINDTHGHDVGDKVLQIASERFNTCLRESDTLARLGGDEFAILLHGINSIENVEAVVARLKETVAEPFTYKNIPLNISVSIGLATFPCDGQTYADLLEIADKAMYCDKQKRKD